LEVTNLYLKKCLKMKWHCKTCRAYFAEVPDLLICPYCNSNRIEEVSNGKHSWK
jgi:Zn finger protein HypA/HybF involved in hydrogenase expression